VAVQELEAGVAPRALTSPGTVTDEETFELRKLLALIDLLAESRDVDPAVCTQAGRQAGKKHGSTC